ncbi:MAG: DNA repair protein RecN [Acidobacteriota bacterium]
MLNYLRIKNLAVIEEITLELQPGLTVFTGETGAGKSILVDGLALALGGRASLDQVRAGADRAMVEAVFTCCRDPQVRKVIESAGLGGDDDQIAIRRVLSPSGSRAYLNDRLVSLTQLRNVGGRLADLHGQHEQQSLLSGGAHRQLLDRFSGCSEVLAAVAAAHGEAVALGRQLVDLQMDDRERVQRADLLRFQVQEIEAAALCAGEEASLQAVRQRLAHAEELAELANEAEAWLYEEEASVAALLHQAERRLERLRQLDPQAPVQPESLRGARFGVEEVARTLQGYLDTLEVDPQRLQEVEARLSVIENLKRKYGDGIEAILEYVLAARKELQSLDHHEEEMSGLEKQLQEASSSYASAAAKLTRLRSQGARRLSEQVCGELHQLAMPAAEFRVVIDSSQDESARGLPPGASRHGNERVEFLLAANPGEGTAPLSRVASGGELSRVMLALKLTATEDDPLETLAFDEVDAGIGGGRVAEHLAQRLAVLARTHQVLVVTHLPQVAAYADVHVGIRKIERAGRAVVEAEPLVADQQVDELARMLGGLKVTMATRKHALEMIATRR